MRCKRRRRRERGVRVAQGRSAELVGTWLHSGGGTSVAVTPVAPPGWISGATKVALQ